MSLGEDHTERDAARHVPRRRPAWPATTWRLGRLVEAVSQSKYWPETAIFVIEDDAQNGPDHVDAHRTVGLVISPYVQRQAPRQHAVQHGQHDPHDGADPRPAAAVSQFDAAANPMFESFTDKPDLTPYKHVPAQIDLNAINEPTAYGAERSSKMDFSEYDRIDDFELNEILWRAIKGVDAPLPPAVRRAIAYRNIEPVKDGK